PTQGLVISTSQSPPVIEVDAISKRFHLRAARRAGTLRDAITGGARELKARLFGHPSVSDNREFWALCEVSFSVSRGDVVGIIGRNGSGKSTLLKILARVTEPTSGSAILRGRVASLLEVGTGFHPELSGRENVYLNGAILGLTRTEIRSRFDEIVGFAEVERFLDTPVKHYSSGMQVRLAFSVAAHLEPDILIVDEVLAVGDVAFQKKCIGKMGEFSRRDSGRTVLFVSHNLSLVRQLCRTALLLDQGRIVSRGPAASVIDDYTQSLASLGPAPAPVRATSERARILETQVTNERGTGVAEVAVGESWNVRLTLQIQQDRMEHVIVAVGLLASDGTPVQTSWSPPQALDPGNYEAVFTQKAVQLEAGTYSLLIGLSERERTLQQFEAGRLHINGDQPIGYFPATSGVGTVLNGMAVELRRLP
ncbi:MAG: ABC transporter ATP-binding protein, partial [Opitutaceae bacterium]|nr:ABC transporter ATP-binding protein [Opitutaceae bacterium]